MAKDVSREDDGRLDFGGRARLQNAIEDMAGHDGSPRERLATAYTTQLVPLRPQDFPDPQEAAAFEQLMDEAGRLSRSVRFAADGRAIADADSELDDQARDVMRRFTEFAFRVNGDRSR